MAIRIRDLIWAEPENGEGASMSSDARSRRPRTRDRGKKLRSRHASIAPPLYSFSPEQPWFDTSRKGVELYFVHENEADLCDPSIAQPQRTNTGDTHHNLSNQTPPLDTTNGNDIHDPTSNDRINKRGVGDAHAQGKDGHVAEQAHSSFRLTDESAEVEVQPQPRFQTSLMPEIGALLSPHQGQTTSSLALAPEPESGGAQVHVPCRETIWGTFASAGSSHLPGASFQYLGNLETECLIAIGSDLVREWAYAGHHERYFQSTIRQCTHDSPPVMNALLTCSATHLFVAPKHKRPDGPIQYHGIQLPSITRQKVVDIHNACVTGLLELCELNKARSLDHILVALILLRHHEGLCWYDEHCRDRSLLIRTFNSFLAAEHKHYTPRSYSSDPFERQRTFEYLRSPRHALLRLALRQELTSACFAQTNLRMSLDLWSFLDGIKVQVSNDFDLGIWADKCLLHCARVVNFCFQTHRTNDSVEWLELKETEQLLEELSVVTMSPLFWQNAFYGVLPLIWFTSTLAIMGTQWLGLAKLLLALYDPNLPRAGPAVRVAQGQLALYIRTLVFTICGIAKSHPTVEPAYIHAQMAIIAGGAYITKIEEQVVLLKILNELERLFGRPTASSIDSLKSVWCYSPMAVQRTCPSVRKHQCLSDEMV